MGTRWVQPLPSLSTIQLHRPLGETLDANTLQLNTSVRRAKEIVFQQFDDELLAVDAQANVCFSLNESAGRIWGMIETPTTLDAICTQLCAEYDVDRETCLAEVSAVLQNLSHAGLVRTGSDASS